MAAIETDLCIIGAGAGGLSVAAVAAQLGVPTVLVEKGRMGGDCLNHGCVPSKAILAAGHAAAGMRAAGRFGIGAAAAPAVDFAAVHRHVHDAIAAIAPNDSEERFTALGATVIKGAARFTGPDRVAVNGDEIRARRFIIAAGGRAGLPPIPGLQDVPYLTNETLWENTVLPRHLVIIGGGPIGLEMAQAHRDLGAEVTVIDAGPIAAREDAELVDGLRQTLAGAGIRLVENARIERVAEAEGGIAVTLAAAEADGAPETITASHLLVAAGRVPNLEGLGLDAAGVSASKLGIVTDRGLRSVSNRRCYAIGDIADVQGIGPRQFTHVANYHAGIVVRSALFRLPAKVDYGALPRVTYTAPELAQTGLTEAEARAAGHADLTILRWPFHENDRAIAERETHGLIKVVATRKGRVLGAGILGPRAGEMINAWSLAIVARVKLATLAGMVVPYPTFAEVGKRAAGQFFVSRLFSERTKGLVRFLRRFG
ncbi:MAG: FAD-dependent oxidoreductase [Alphaproteobacteria bacterium]|nr:FAD-dependent oxidoreductase [Alphaproteobacteria bacterium]